MTRWFFLYSIILFHSSFAYSANMMSGMIASGGSCYELDSSWTPAWVNVVGYWNLNSSFNATTGPNLTATGAGASISAVGAKLGTRAASFDATAGAGAAASSDFSFPNTTFTVSAWVKTTSSAVNNFYVSNGGIGGGWALKVQTDHFDIFVKNAANGQVVLSTSRIINDGRWHHIVAVITTNTSSEAGNTAIVFIDGSSEAVTQSLPGNGAYADLGSAAAVGIGGRSFPGGTNFFSGQVDEVAIWNTALTTAQIKTIYDQQSCGQN